MGKQIVMIAVLIAVLPFIAYAECYENCYDSPCDVPGACETECDSDTCYYYDADGDCWKYDMDFGFYPCECVGYQCDDCCCHEDDCDHDHDCDSDCHHHHDDDDWGYYTCFIGTAAVPAR